MKERILFEAHDQAGHQGMDKTLNRLKSVGFWVGINTDVVSYVASCEVCQKAKLPLPCKAPLINTPAGRILHYCKLMF